MQKLRSVAKAIDRRLPDELSYAGRRFLGHPSVPKGTTFADYQARNVRIKAAPTRSVVVDSLDHLLDTDLPAYIEGVEKRVASGDVTPLIIERYGRACITAGQPERLIASYNSWPSRIFRGAKVLPRVFSAAILVGDIDLATIVARQVMAIGAFNRGMLLSMIADCHLLKDDALLLNMAYALQRSYGSVLSPQENIFLANVLLNRVGIDAAISASRPSKQLASVDMFLYEANVAMNVGRFGTQVDLTNDALAEFGLRPVDLIDASKPLSAFNLKGGLNELVNGGDKVSILMAAFNCADLIESALASLSAQDYTNIEIIVVDDCSTDNTVDVVERYAVEKDNRVRLIRAPENGGTYRARNIGLQNATGRYFTVNDSDDWSHPQKIGSLVAAVQESGVAAQSQLLRVSRRYGYKPKLLGYAHADQSSLMFDRDLVVEKLGGYDSSRRFGADSEFSERIIAGFGPSAIKMVEKPFLFSDWSPHSISGSMVTGITDGGLMAPARCQYKLEYRQRHRSEGDLKMPIC